MLDLTPWRPLLAAACLLLLAGPALAQPAETPQRIGPEWGWQKHQPNPAEIEARSRARGRPTQADQARSAEVDRLFRDLTGQDPNAPRRMDARAADRR
jgi:hypothetical protein